MKATETGNTLKQVNRILLRQLVEKNFTIYFIFSLCNGWLGELLQH